MECMRGRTALAYLGWASTGVRDDYVMAGVYTRIYMALMRNIAILLACVAISVYRTTAWPSLLAVFVQARSVEG